MFGIVIAGLGIFLWVVLEFIDFLRWVFPGRRNRG